MYDMTSIFGSNIHVDVLSGTSSIYTYAEINAINTSSNSTLRTIGKSYGIGTAYSSSQMYNVNGNGAFVKGTYIVVGVRPVVTLKSNFKISSNNTGDGSSSSSPW